MDPTDNSPDFDSPVLSGFLSFRWQRGGHEFLVRFSRHFYSIFACVSLPRMRASIYLCVHVLANLRADVRCCQRRLRITVLLVSHLHRFGFLGAPRNSGSGDVFFRGCFTLSAWYGATWTWKLIVYLILLRSQRRKFPEPPLRNYIYAQQSLIVDRE